LNWEFQPKPLNTHLFNAFFSFITTIQYRQYGLSFGHEEGDVMDVTCDVIDGTLFFPGLPYIF
jgi:hypothetical protein